MVKTKKEIAITSDTWITACIALNENAFRIANSGTTLEHKLANLNEIRSALVDLDWNTTTVDTLLGKLGA